MQTPITPPETTETQNTPATRQNELDAYLRESIIGSYIRSVNKRLRTLSREVEESEQRVDEKIAALETQFQTELEALKAEIRNLPQGLESLIDTRIDAKLNGITHQGEDDLQKLSSLINDFAREFQAQLDRLRTETQRIREQTQRTNEALRAELTAETETLDIGKVDRLTLADALITLGTQLKEEHPSDVDLDEVLALSEEPEA
ncbi:hypothetical protein C6495_05910 [Candidatus Poribacteria bacterium]|nr:MAG: hypothetical protein C6495_05910 [Candidatus Poribacteria bacterium]